MKFVTSLSSVHWVIRCLCKAFFCVCARAGSEAMDYHGVFRWWLSAGYCKWAAVVVVATQL